MKILVLFSCAFAIVSAGLYSPHSYASTYGFQGVHVPQFDHNEIHLDALEVLPKIQPAALYTLANHIQHEDFAFLDDNNHVSNHEAPVDTPEVLHAKAQHFAAHEEARKASKYGYTITPVETHEVQLAKAAHFKAVEEARKASKYGYTITPVETHEVQLAKAAHFKAVEEARNNKLHYTITPVETLAVQHAKAEHFAAHAKAKAQSDHDSYNSYGFDHHRRRRGILSVAHHVPVITKDGVPLETPEVQHARAEHLAAVAQAKSEASYHGDDYSSGFDHAGFSDYSDFTGHAQVAHSLGDAHFFGGSQGIAYSSGVIGGVHSGGLYGSHDANPWNYGSGYTLIHNGKHPVDTYEVEKAKALHFAAHANAKAQQGFDVFESYGNEHHRRRRGLEYTNIWAHEQHVPIIGKDGVPLDTPEVQKARSEHLAAVAKAKIEANGHGKLSEFSGLYGNDHLELFAGQSLYPSHDDLSKYGASFGQSGQNAYSVHVDHSSGTYGKDQSFYGIGNSHESNPWSYGLGSVHLVDGKYLMDTHEVQKAKELHFAALEKAHHY